MKKYVLDLDYGHHLHAGSKAPSDAIAFLKDAGYEPLVLHEINTLKYFLFPFDFLRAYFKVEKGSEVVFQFPVHSKSTFRVALRLASVLARKGVRRVALVHDVDFGRDFGSVGKDEQLRRLNCFSSLIVHSPQMEAMLKENGCDLPCSILGLFDYRVVKPNVMERKLGPDVVFAGNLGKSGFLRKLSGLVSDGLRFHLYGIGEQGIQLGGNLVYHGRFSPDDLSSIVGSWGLVWDGPETDSCSGSFGKYLEVNSPHKASLYVCAGLPLIVPEGSAVADIVLRENLGIAVPSLDVLSDRLAAVSKDEYESMLSSVKAYSLRLATGKNLLSAL